MRRVLILAAICCVIVPVNGQKARAKSNANQKATIQSQNPTNHTITIDTVNVNKLDVAQQASTADKPNQNTGKPASYFHRLITPENLPNIVLCAVGIAGIIVAICTLKVIARQSDATERSVRLQEVQYKQWVVFENWRAYSPRENWIQIQVDISNQTNFPLTFERAIFRVGTTEQHSSGKHEIPPKTSYTLDFGRDLLPEEQAEWLKGHVVFGVRGGVWFTGVLRSDFQPLGGLISAGRMMGVNFTPQTEHEQSAQDHYGEKSAN